MQTFAEKSLPDVCIAGKPSRLAVVFGLTGSISVWFELSKQTAWLSRQFRSSALCSEPSMLLFVG